MILLFKKLFILFIILIIIDLIWLYIIKDRYKNMIINIQKKQFDPKMPYALLVYFIIAYALYHFTKDSETLSEKLKNAFIFGFCSYGIYDFTNAALFSDWDIPLAIADSIWGGLLCTITVYITHKFNII
jgi:uncharacterized membrane protein